MSKLGKINKVWDVFRQTLHIVDKVPIEPVEN